MRECDKIVVQQFPEGSFERLFWQQQFQAASGSDPRQVRWHPAIIKWCLNLKLISSTAYEAMRSTGFIRLPSQRTLRDYTHWAKAQAGFPLEVDHQLRQAANIDQLEDWQKYTVLTFDEVRIKSDLVYHKDTGNLIGFVDIGKINNCLSDLQWSLESNTSSDPKLATHMLVFMVRGLFTR